MTEYSDAQAAAVFRRLVNHLQQRSDAQNVDLMGLAGFCRNCLGDWLAEASDGALSKDAGRETVYGMPYTEWKAASQQPASTEQIARISGEGRPCPTRSAAFAKAFRPNSIEETARLA